MLQKSILMKLRFRTTIQIFTCVKPYTNGIIFEFSYCNYDSVIYIKSKKPNTVSIV